MTKFNSHKWIKLHKMGRLHEADPTKLAQWSDDKKSNIAGQTKPFQPGDMWSNDFDYVGMLKFGANTYLSDGLNVMHDLYESFTDVNYHTEAKDLGNAIEWYEERKGVEDEEKAMEFMEMFREACMKTLKDWKVKYTPEKR